MDIQKTRSQEIKDLHRELGNKVYDACAAFELAEMVGVIDRNGHHIRQKVSMAVQNYFRQLLNSEYQIQLEHKEVWSNDLKLV